MRPERFPVVSVLDEAIDTELMTIPDIVKYYETRDIKDIQPFLKPGVKPTVYHVRAVPHSLWQSFVLAGGDHEQMLHRRAFMAGIERVENLVGNDGVGVNWAPTQRLSDKLTILSEQECNERFSPYEVNEIGAVIYKHSFLPRRIIKPYPLPSSCVEALTQRQFRYAAPNPSNALTESSSQPSSAIDPPTEATAST